MKKYFVVSDLQDATTQHINEIPANMFVHVKACNDGLAAVVGDKDNDTMLGFTIACAPELSKVLSRLIIDNKTSDVENFILEELVGDIEEFLGDEEETIFDLDRISLCMSDILNALLVDVTRRQQQEKTKTKKNKKAKANKSNQN